MRAGELLVTNSANGFLALYAILIFAIICAVCRCVVVGMSGGMVEVGGGGGGNERSATFLLLHYFF